MLNSDKNKEIVSPSQESNESKISYFPTSDNTNLRLAKIGLLELSKSYKKSSSKIIDPEIEDDFLYLSDRYLTLSKKNNLRTELIRNNRLKPYERRGVDFEMFEALIHLGESTRKGKIMLALSKIFRF